jgi:hypothetical protein
MVQRAGGQPPEGTINLTGLYSQNKPYTKDFEVFLGISILRRLLQTILRFPVACFAWVLATALAAHGALGGDIASVQTDQVHMHGSMRMSTATGYTVQEIQGSNGIVVREYVSQAGKVFGVAWQGPWPPDLRQLLGSYFGQYEQAVKAQRAEHIGRRPLLINEPGLVVGMGGHPRSFFGHAYVPEMLPAGVHAEDIQ